MDSASILSLLDSISKHAFVSLGEKKLRLAILAQIMQFTLVKLGTNLEEKGTVFTLLAADNLNSIHEAYHSLNCDIEEFIALRLNEKCQMGGDLKYQNYMSKEATLLKCDAILDHCWEQLHTGDWHQMSRIIRTVFAYHQLLKAMLILLEPNNEPEKLNSTMISSLQQALVCIDYGLIMSPDLEGRLLATVASLLHQVLVLLLDKSMVSNELSIKWADTLRCTPSKVIPIPQLLYPNSIPRVNWNDLDFIEFERDYFGPKKPVIICNALLQWPCMSSHKWNLPYLLRQMAFRSVPIELGSKYTDESFSQKIMTVLDFVQKYMIDDATNTGYLAQYSLFQQVLELSGDISVPDLCAASEHQEGEQGHALSQFEVNAWFGPAGTVSPLHFDARHNLFAQLLGTKYLRLYSDKTPHTFIYPNEGNTLMENTSQVNLEHVDHDKFPNFSKIDRSLCFECVLHEGEMLFIPKKYWHFVKSHSTSFSVNYWWD